MKAFRPEAEPAGTKVVCTADPLIRKPETLAPPAGPTGTCLDSARLLAAGVGFAERCGARYSPLPLARLRPKFA